MNLRSFDESLLANLSSPHLFRGMLHGYEFILSRVISRTILRRAPCTHDDYLFNTSHLLDCSYFSKSICEKIAFEERLKSYRAGSHLFHSKFWYLPPLLGVGRNGEGWEREKKRNIRKEVTREWRAKNCQKALSDFKESLKQYFSRFNNLRHSSEKSLNCHRAAASTELWLRDA